ncbi:hypothetical protein [Companilactobacillus baiquanensis]|uniref:Uncharacterized protein n=1 Tax=Companilactobacillus baiquanensis TaxID=2486005 RepID=A0ABW1UWB5_9LACO|nr:hypothetical protein [Companilactobacillus baiquanensis]
MSTIRDAWLRDFATQLPLGIDIKDDDGNVIHSSIGDRKTHKITLYSAWLGKSSGGSTGGNTGGNTGDDGGDTGGTTTNPGHETVGDDVYPGDVNKGEVTKRFKLWQGPSNTNADTTVTFNQDLGENLDGLGDGLQARLSMVETPYFDGKATKSKKIQITNGESGLNKFSTTAPIPISLKKGRLASKDTLKVDLNGDGSKETVFAGPVYDIPNFISREDVSGKKITHYNFGSGFQNPPSTISTSVITSNSFIIERNQITDETADRTGTRLVVYKDGEKYAVGPMDISIVQVEGLTPATVYKSGQFTVQYEDINGNPTSNSLSVKQFTTKPIDDIVLNPTALPTFQNTSIANWTNPGIFPAQYYPSYGKNIAMIGSKSIVINALFSGSGYSLALLDADNQIVALGNPGVNYLIYDGIQPNHTYTDFKLTLIFTRKVLADDTRINPSVSFKYNDDGTMNVNTTQGSIKDKDDNLISTFDLTVDYVNSYTSQKEVSQLTVGSYLFVGDSTSASLVGVSKDFNNIGDGLEIHFVDPATSTDSVYRTRLAYMGLPSVVRIPKQYILNGISNYSLLDSPLKTYLGVNDVETYYQGTWKNYKAAYPNGSLYYYVGCTSLSFSFSNGTVEVEGNLAAGKGSSSLNTVDEIIAAIPKSLPHIAYVTNYKEGE